MRRVLDHACQHAHGALQTLSQGWRHMVECVAHTAVYTASSKTRQVAQTLYTRCVGLNIGRQHIVAELVLHGVRTHRVGSAYRFCSLWTLLKERRIRKEAVIAYRFRSALVTGSTASSCSKRSHSFRSMLTCRIALAAKSSGSARVDEIRFILQKC